MDNPNGESPSPLTALTAAAVSMHELYTEYVKAGFTKAEAMEILKALITKRP
ncbi:hypothetical protein [Streptomyces sp. TBY4]|uniref:hypothetical protein n=1 Tax=Streptomyces sp. TBY4 TaxID=2962030 RepID=UPI0020B6FFA0|nr:hypothetical protein [Streptomyces sp. TBY4]MCP3758200.1 hypothetical protein [Streptomyces sp. TBY4]